MNHINEFAIYISWDSQDERDRRKNCLHQFLKKQVADNYTIVETACGVVLTLKSKKDADKITNKNINNLTEAIGSVTLLQMSPKKSNYKQGVFLQEVPWSLPLEELQTALNQQGMRSARVERKRQYVRVEVTEPEHYESLLRNGFQFFNVTRFPAIPDRGARTSFNWHDRRSNLKADANFVMQCYRCQGWWHTAPNCRYRVRCVRCGGNHSVDSCQRSRSDPVCCHCFGPHAASNKICPVRLEQVNALPISLTLSTNSSIPCNPYQHVL